LSKEPRPKLHLASRIHFRFGLTTAMRRPPPLPPPDRSDPIPGLAFSTRRYFLAAC